MVSEIVVVAMLLCPTAQNFVCTEKVEEDKISFVVATTQWKKIEEKTIYCNNNEVNFEKQNIRNRHKCTTDRQ